MGPVHQVEIDLFHAKAPKAYLRLSDRVIPPPPRKKLGRDEHLVTRHAALPQRAADAFLIPVCLSRVNVPVSGLERPAHGVDALTPVWHLPDAKAEHATWFPSASTRGLPPVAVSMPTSIGRRTGGEVSAT